MTVPPTSSDLYGGAPSSTIVDILPFPPAEPRSAPRVLRRLPWPLLGILAVQAGLSLRLVWSNTAFSDEALYIWAGHMEWDHWLHGLNIAHYGFQYYFSGAPVIYPPLAALADSLGGITAARLLSLIIMLIATVLLWSVTKRLYDSRAAFYAAALFALIGCAQDLGAFATYDAMAILCLALAFWLGIRGVYAKSAAASIALYTCSALAMGLGDAVKYATALWNPVVILAILATVWRVRGSWQRGVRSALFVTAVLCAAIGLALREGGRSYVYGIMFTTLDRKVEDIYLAPAIVLWVGFSYVWIIVFLSMTAVIGKLAVRRGARGSELVFSVAMAVAPLLPIIAAAHAHSAASVYKHVVFGAWFAAVTSGHMLAAANSAHPRKGWRIGAAVLALAALAGYGQGTTQYEYWPGTAVLVPELRSVLSTTSGPVLCQELRPVNYYLGPDVNTQRFTGLTLPIDASPEDSPLYQQVVKSIRRHYYKVIEINTQQPPPGAVWTNKDNEGAEIARVALVYLVNHTAGYRPVATIPWRDAWYDGDFHIWKYVGGAR
jgi:4-amino-4-deoxy-L-arabinose transferase-like glycosyltransferase